MPVMCFCTTLSLKLKMGKQGNLSRGQPGKADATGYRCQIKGESGTLYRMRAEVTALKCCQTDTAWN